MGVFQPFGLSPQAAKGFFTESGLSPRAAKYRLHLAVLLTGAGCHYGSVKSSQAFLESALASIAGVKYPGCAKEFPFTEDRVSRRYELSRGRLAPNSVGMLSHSGFHIPVVKP